MKIAAFNVKKLGWKKVNNDVVRRNLIMIVSRYSVVVMLEVVDQSGEAMDKFLTELNNHGKNRNHPYTMVCSESLGRGAYKEKFVYFYRQDDVKMLNSYQYQQEDGAEQDEDEGEYEDGEGGYEEDEGEYEEYQGGYEDDEAEYEDDEGEYEEDEGEYEEDEGEYEDDEAEYEDDEGEYEEYQGGYEDDEAEYEEDEGKYEEDEGEYEDDEGEYEECRGGYEDEYEEYQGGYEQDEDEYEEYQGGYEQDEEEYEEYQGGYEDEYEEYQGGYEQDEEEYEEYQGGYEQDEEEYEECRGGYEQDEDEYEEYQGYEQDEAVDGLARAPFILQFECPNTVVQKLVLIPVHTKPEDAEKELNALHDVVEDVRKRWRTDNIMILGDFNADGRYLSGRRRERVRIRSEPYYWLIGDDVDTTTSNCNDHTYDRIVVFGDHMYSAVVPRSAQAFNFQRAYRLTDETTKAISDHYPVEVELREN